METLCYYQKRAKGKFKPDILTTLINILVHINQIGREKMQADNLKACKVTMISCLKQTRVYSQITSHTRHL